MVVLAGGNQKQNGINPFKALKPFLALRSLAADVDKPKRKNRDANKNRSKEETDLNGTFSMSKWYSIMPRVAFLQSRMSRFVGMKSCKYNVHLLRVYLPLRRKIHILNVQYVQPSMYFVCVYISQINSATILAKVCKTLVFHFCLFFIHLLEGQFF